MFCPNCGKEQAENAKFCIACGHKLPNTNEKPAHKEEKQDPSGTELNLDPSLEINPTDTTTQNATPIQTPAQAPTSAAAPTYTAAHMPAQVPAPVQPTYSYPTQAPAPAQPTYSYPTQAPAPVQPTYSYPTQAPAPVQPTYSYPTQAPAPVQPTYSYPAQTQAPAATRASMPYSAPNPIGTVAGAASKVSGGVKWTIALSVIAAIAVLLFALFYKTDEQKIEDRIESFNIACSNGDIQGMFDCFDNYTRTMYSTTIGLTEGIIGGLTGFDLPLGDLFNLFAMDSFGGEGLGLEIEIESIEVNDHTAIVTLTDACAESLGQDTIIMCKEEDDWFIDLRATEAAAPVPEDTETEDTNDSVAEAAAMR